MCAQVCMCMCVCESVCQRLLPSKIILGTHVSGQVNVILFLTWADIAPPLSPVSVSQFILFYLER